MIILLFGGVWVVVPGTDTLMYKAETDDDNVVPIIEDASQNVFDVFPSWNINYIEKLDGYLYRINDFGFNGNGYASNNYDSIT